MKGAGLSPPLSRENVFILVVVLSLFSLFFSIREFTGTPIIGWWHTLLFTLSPLALYRVFQLLRERFETRFILSVKEVAERSEKGEGIESALQGAGMGLEGGRGDLIPLLEKGRIEGEGGISGTISELLAILLRGGRDDGAPLLEMAEFEERRRLVEKGVKGRIEVRLFIIRFLGLFLVPLLFILLPNVAGYPIRSYYYLFWLFVAFLISMMDGLILMDWEGTVAGLPFSLFLSWSSMVKIPYLFTGG